MRTGVIVGIVAVVLIAIVAIFVFNSGSGSQNTVENQDNTQNQESLTIIGEEETSTGTPTGQTGSQTESESTSQEFTVEITSSGFNPKTLEISQGDTVIWINKMSSSSWPASAVHPTHNVYPGFDANRGLKTGESYSFTFDRVGSWNYHDHLSPSTTGKITVK